jgi:hypothetical protein
VFQCSNKKTLEQWNNGTMELFVLVFS